MNDNVGEQGSGIGGRSPKRRKFNVMKNWRFNPARLRRRKLDIGAGTPHEFPRRPKYTVRIRRMFDPPGD